MANANHQESFEKTWERCKTHPFTKKVMNPNWVKHNTSLVISQLIKNMENCKNPHKIKLHEDRIAYLKMMRLLET